MAFAAGLTAFVSLGALTSLTSLASFVSEVGASTSLLDTETALATGLVSGAFSDVVVGLATASVFGCASVFVHLFLQLLLVLRHLTLIIKVY